MFRAQLLLLTTFVGTPVPLSSQHPEASPTIIASARGEVRLPPDVAVLRIGVASRASTAAAAATESSRRVRAVTDTLRRMGLAPELSAPVALEVRTNEAVAEGRLVDYEARALITVRIRDFARLGVIIDAALAGGATTVPSVRFDSDTAAAARADALARAYREAENRARAVARAAGVTLGPIVELRADPSFMDDLDDDFVIEDLPFAPSRSPRREVPVAATVTVTWRLVQVRH